ncbi:MAG: metal-dependent transcriptional regulator [Bacteroidia bacterium]|nr:metal-dependent transcriptional regulator [Bacteroidia bacterium]MBP9725272.1 metal-dependent transcriptional regulator [Bacteroidia bacterium]
MYSFTEENYLKAIYKLSQDDSATTNAIAVELKTKAASVTDMLKKLADKKLITYVKYQGVSLTEKGRKVAVITVRKHRLWEVFLHEKLEFKWDEVHEIAEQLEHIQSDVLMDKLDAFLNFPTVDPHGDPIPRRDGTIKDAKLKVLSDISEGKSVIMSGVKEHSPVFLQYLEKTGLLLGKKIKVNEILKFDGSVQLQIGKGSPVQISKEVAKNILVANA